MSQEVALYQSHKYAKVGLVLLALFSPISLFDYNQNFFWEYSTITCVFILLVGNVVINLGNTVNLLSIAGLLAVLQWLIGPMITYIIDYEFFASDEIMLFKVPQDQYFNYTLPATLAFLGGLFILKPKSKHFKELPVFLKNNRTNAQKLGPILFSIGIFFTLLPIPLGYFGWLLKGCLQLSVIAYWLFNLKHKMVITVVGFGIIAVDAVLHGMFGELIYWTLFMGIIISLSLRVKLVHKLALTSLGAIILFVISTTKWQYRILTWNNNSYTSIEKIELYRDIIVSNFQNDKIDRVRAGQEVIVRRLNQGGTISHIMNRVPKTQPYAEGETIFSAIATAIVPRLFWPSKPVAGKKDFYRFTGYRLKGTSMGITPIGEAYANFGKRGGILTMFVYGLFISSIYRFMISKSLHDNSLLIVMIPIVFFRVIYAESDMMRTLTAAIKGLMFVFILRVFINSLTDRKIL